VRVPVLPSATEEELSSSGMSRLLGQTLGGRYRLRAILGEGGMGTVFEAEHLTLGRVVAVKVLHPSHARRSVAVQRFQKEARSAGTIGHPNICEVYDLGELADGSPFLVMERLMGETLADRIARDGALEVSDVADLMLQVLSGLHAAHAKGILHRDIKPENIFLNARVGVGPVAKILDFGVAKDIGPQPAESVELTLTGMVMGTPFYLSPEQARGERNLDQRTDLYACGVVLYEALTGHRPFGGTNYNALLRAILVGDPHPLRELRPDVPPDFEFVVARAMARDRADRFQSAIEMMESLAPYYGGSTRSLPSPSSSDAFAAVSSAASSRSGGRGSQPPVERRSAPPISPRPARGDWDEATVYDPALQQRIAAAHPPPRRSEPPLDHSGSRAAGAPASSGLDLEYDEETVRTSAPSEIARQMREQLRRSKKG
jgi:serine/threonine-protein kinase